MGERRRVATGVVTLVGAVLGDIAHDLAQSVPVESGGVACLTGPERWRRLGGTC